MISFDEAKSHLRVTHDDEDADIRKKLYLASAIVQDYTGIYPPPPPADENTEWPIPTAIEEATANVLDAATLLVLGELYANREASSDPLSPSVKAILGRLRKPVFA